MSNSNTGNIVSENGAIVPPPRLQQIRQLIANCEFASAATECEAALADNLSLEIEAEIRCLWTEALEHIAHFTQALQVLAQYENRTWFNLLPTALQCRVAFRLGAAYGGTSDIPKAISQSRMALQLAQQHSVREVEHQCLVLMSVLFRKLGELQIAQNYLAPIIENPADATPEIVAQAHNSLGIIRTLEGKWDEARQAYITAIDAVCEKDAPLLRGSLDVNLAAVVSLQGKMREAKVLLERALPQLIRAGNPRLIANARSNLGYNLLRLGQIAQAQVTLKAALEEAKSCEINLIVASTLETLGECHSIQGQFAEAEVLLQQSLKILDEMRVSFNKTLALCTYGRHLLLQGHFAAAQQAFEESRILAQQSGDPCTQAEAELYLIEAMLAQGELQKAQQLFHSIKETIEKLDSLYVLGHLWEVAGLLARQEQDLPESIRRFKQACSIWEVVEELYRCARMRYLIGVSYEAMGNLGYSQKYLQLAQQAFQQTSARPMLELTEKALHNITNRPAPVFSAPEVTNRLIDCLKSLTESAFKIDLALPEFTRLLHEDFSAVPIVIFRQERDQHLAPLAYKGCDHKQAQDLAARVWTDHLHPEEYLSRISLNSEQTYWLYLKRNAAELTNAMLDLFVWHLRTILTQYATLPEHHAAAFLSPAEELLPMPGLSYCSPAMRTIVEQAHRLSQSNINVLITGESGTGKELVARGIHLLSQRATKPFVPFNCAAAPRELLESQIFGHRRGAFTGASNNFSGVVGAANKGTLFLDEIGDLALEMQPKLLRFIQSGEVQKVGEATPGFVDVRLIAATNCDLEKLVEAGRFRADLYYRLNVIRFHLPALRERREEIPLLARHFLQQYSTQMQKADITLLPATIAALEQYEWPGNARELESELHRVVALLASGSRVAPHHLSSNIYKTDNATIINTPTPEATNKTLARLLDETQQSIISTVLEKNAWNISRSAKELGVSRFSLRNMMKRFNLSTR